MMKIRIDQIAEKQYIYPELQGHFIEFLGNCIYDGIWVGEDSDVPNYHGIRKDFVDAFRKLHPPIIRWPGGCYADTYHWRDGIGKKETRPVTYNENFGTYELDSNEFGTHEFAKLCQLVGAKPWFNINMMSGTVKEMRDWMEYCNREEPTALSEERRKNGSKEPFRVEYWGIGNECWGGGGNMTAQMYANEYRKYATAVPSFDNHFGGNGNSSAIKCIACGPDGNKPRESVRWTKDFFREMAQYRKPPIFGYDLHFYNWNLKQESETDFDEAQWYEVIEGCKQLEDVILEQSRLVQEGMAAIPDMEGMFSYGDKECKLIIGEWGNWHKSAFTNRPALYQQCTMRDAVTTAITLDILHRNSTRVRMACVAQSVNVLNSLFLTKGEQCILTPNYYVFELYQVHQGAYVLPLEKTEEKNLYTFASVKGQDIYLNVINADYSESHDIELSCVQEMDFCGVKTLKGDKPESYNSFENPECIKSKAGEKPVRKGDCYRMQIPAASVSVYHFRLKK